MNAPSGARRRILGALGAMGAFARRVVDKAADDEIFFMAGAIAFNVLIAFVPLALAVLGIAGTILRFQQPDAQALLLDYVINALPPVSAEFERTVGQGVGTLIDQSTGLLSLGTIFLLWVATRLVGTLRTVLREIFDVRRARGIVGGKLFDLKMVFAAGTLFTINFTVTVLLRVIAGYGREELGLGAGQALEAVWGRAVAFSTIWLMFMLVYRYLPARRIRWRTAITAATFTAVLFELMKEAFAWYVTNLANYESTYGGVLAPLVLLILWIYYSSIVFILGGQVAQVAAMQRVRRKQKERLR